MATHEELVQLLEGMDRDIETLRGQLVGKEQERLDLIGQLGGHPLAPEPLEGPTPLPQGLEDWFGPPAQAQPEIEHTQRIPRHAYVPVMVHREAIPPELDTCMRLNAGIYEVHLLPRTLTGMIPIPAETHSVCGLQSTSEGWGHQSWWHALMEPGVTHAELCRRCIVQVEQVSRTV